MSGTIEVRTDDTAGEASAGKVDMKLEVVTIPVYDVDRATAFYRSLGWRQDVTPPGSACSVQFGTNRTSSVPGSAQNQFLIVPDLQVARDELVGRSVDVSEVFYLGPDGPAGGPDPERRSRSPSLDAVGTLLAIFGLGGLIYALTDRAGSSWGSVRILIAFAVGALSLVALVPTERRRPAPILKLALFASRQFDAVNVATVLLYGALTAVGYLIIIDLELKLGYPATQAGAALIPVTVVFLVLAPLSGALVSRIGSRWPMVAGILLAAESQGWLAQLHHDSGYGKEILPAALVRGAELGLAVTPLTAAALVAVGDADLGEASAINDAATRVGGVIAVGLVPVLIGVGAGTSLSEAPRNGYESAMVVIGGLCVAAAIVTWLFVSDERAEAPPLAAPDRSWALPVREAEATS